MTAFPTTQSWWSQSDRDTVLAVLERLKPVRVLEFGPGSSTRALLDGGVELIHTCEDDPTWAAIWHARLEAHYPDRVLVIQYTWSDPLEIPALGTNRYDLALIDGPRTTMQRIAVARYCFDRCTVVLSPAEKDNRTYQPALERAARDAGRRIEIIDSGPPSYGFLLLT